MAENLTDTVRQAVGRRDTARTAEAAALDLLYAAIGRAAAGGVRQNELVQITGYSRERLRQICKTWQPKPGAAQDDPPPAHPEATVPEPASKATAKPSREAKPKTGMCEHRVPAGAYCKRCTDALILMD